MQSSFSIRIEQPEALILSGDDKKKIIQLQYSPILDYGEIVASNKKKDKTKQKRQVIQLRRSRT